MNGVPSLNSPSSSGFYLFFPERFGGKVKYPFQFFALQLFLHDLLSYFTCVSVSASVISFCVSLIFIQLSTIMFLCCVCVNLWNL